MALASQLACSFRDPDGFLFRHRGILYRQVNQSYKSHYDRLMQSGLYQELTSDSLLVAHEDVSASGIGENAAYKTLRPAELNFISYPYEWCFSALKDAALLTLEIQKRALAKNMSLKDASAYNVQFEHGRAIFIDSLSFENYQEGAPWAAYRQFCQHFLAPLACMSFVDFRSGQLLRAFIDGLPLELAVRMLPFHAFLRPGLFTHLYLHAFSQKHFSKQKAVSKKSISKFSLRALIDSLESTIRGLTWRLPVTSWSDYYSETNYSDSAATSKKELVEKIIAQVQPKAVWDLGANRGDYSRLASARGISTVAFDFDAVCVELNYLEIKRAKERALLPLLMDFTNPSAALGFANQERDSLQSRGPVDLILCLAFVHHMAIANNVPFALLAKYLSNLCSNLLIEFVPKSDSQAQRLLASRADIFSWYTQENFESEFSASFLIKAEHAVKDSQRVLYLMQKL